MSSREVQVRVSDRARVTERDRERGGRDVQVRVSKLVRSLAGRSIGPVRRSSGPTRDRTENRISHFSGPRTGPKRTGPVRSEPVLGLVWSRTENCTPLLLTAISLISSLILMLFVAEFGRS